jgi:hypothetical protein
LLNGWSSEKSSSFNLIERKRVSQRVVIVSSHFYQYNFLIRGTVDAEREGLKVVLLHNGGFCITKWILLLQAFHSQENQYADYEKKIFLLI